MRNSSQVEGATPETKTKNQNEKSKYENNDQSPRLPYLSNKKRYLCINSSRRHIARRFRPVSYTTRSQCCRLQRVAQTTTNTIEKNSKMKTETMKTLIRKELREMEISNGEILDHKTQIRLCRSIAGDNCTKINSFHLALNSMTTGNHVIQGSDLILTDSYL